MRQYGLYLAQMLVITSVITGCDADVSFLSDFHVSYPDAGIDFAGSECNALGRYGGDESSSEGVDIGIDGPYLRESTNIERDRVKVKISYKEETIYKKTYSESFLESGEVDRFEYEGRDGLIYIWRFWGGDDCSFEPDASIRLNH